MCPINLPSSNRRAVAAIHRNVEELNERSIFSRHLYARSDKDAITDWKSDLNRILLVFNVRLIVPSPLFLQTYPQTEFSVNTHVVAVDIHQEVANTQTMVSNIHRTVVERREGDDCANQSVSYDFVLTLHENNFYCCLDSKKVCEIVPRIDLAPYM